MDLGDKRWKQGHKEGEDITVKDCSDLDQGLTVWVGRSGKILVFFESRVK